MEAKAKNTLKLIHNVVFKFLFFSLIKAEHCFRILQLE
jgi:hypothetical protein